MTEQRVDPQDRLRVRALLQPLLVNAASVTLHMCWHGGEGHGYPPEVLAAAARLRDRHGRDCDDTYTSMTFSPSHSDIDDFIEVAGWCDLAYATNLSDEDLVMIEGAGPEAVIRLGTYS